MLLTACSQHGLAPILTTHTAACSSREGHRPCEVLALGQVLIVRALCLCLSFEGPTRAVFAVKMVFHIGATPRLLWLLSVCKAAAGRRVSTTRALPTHYKVVFSNAGVYARVAPHISAAFIRTLLVSPVGIKPLQNRGATPMTSMLPVAFAVQLSTCTHIDVVRIVNCIRHLLVQCRRPSRLSINQHFSFIDCALPTLNSGALFL
mmetsp:Transcript_250/g.299  ORF Transcript_250/g.299 Transcript_250/m.299 type:complete len:205 (+) Transcript_250:1264-1878(+)